MGKRTRESKLVQPGALSGTPSAWIAHAAWLAPFLLFLVVRLFSGDPYYLLAGDQCTFLEMARTFPKHQLFNHELYLIHPPVFDYAIGLVHLVLPPLTSGLATTLLFACGAFFAIRQLGRFDRLPGAAIFAGLIYLALNRPAVSYDYHVARVSPLVCATALAILAFLHLLRTPTRKALMAAIAANVLCLLVSDQGLMVLPCEAVILWARGGFGQWRWWAPVGVGSAAAAFFWPLVRMLEFSSRGDLPAGIDGTIEFTRNLPWMALIQPNYLPFTNAHRSLFTQTSLSLWNIQPALLAGLPTDLLLIPRVLSAALVILLVAAALADRERRRRALQWLALSVFFLLPVGLGMNEWYGMGFVVPFSLLIMEGAAACFARAATFLRNPDLAIAAALAAACALAAIVWLGAPLPAPHGFLQPTGGSNFLFARPAVTRAATVSKFFAAMPRDTGIMAPQGLSPEVVYLTDKRVVALPFDPALLDQFIAQYHIAYLLTSSEYLQRFDSPKVDRYTSRLVTAYILEHPERYRLVSRVREDYPAFYDPLEYYVFQVQARPAI